MFLIKYFSYLLNTTSLLIKMSDKRACVRSALFISGCWDVGVLHPFWRDTSFWGHKGSWGEHQERAALSWRFTRYSSKGSHRMDDQQSPGRETDHWWGPTTPLFLGWWQVNNKWCLIHLVFTVKWRLVNLVKVCYIFLKEYFTVLDYHVATCFYEIDRMHIFTLDFFSSCLLEIVSFVYFQFFRCCSCLILWQK